MDMGWCRYKSYQYLLDICWYLLDIYWIFIGYFLIAFESRWNTHPISLYFLFWPPGFVQQRFYGYGYQWWLWPSVVGEVAASWFFWMSSIPRKFLSAASSFNDDFMEMHNCNLYLFMFPIFCMVCFYETCDNTPTLVGATWDPSSIRPSITDV